MNDFSVLSAASITFGIVLVYAAVKGMYPQDVIRGLMGKDPIHPPLGAAKSFGRKLQPTQPSSTTTPGTPTDNGIFIPGQPVTSV